MDWRKVSDGYAKVFVRENGTPVVAYFEKVGEETRTTFFADLDDIETGVDELGGLQHVIDDLQPQDIMEICCLDQKFFAPHDSK